jgi:squalene cyclase
VYAGLLAHGEKGGETQSALTTLLASQQDDSGRWGFSLHREPIQSSAFTTTALAVRLLQTFLPKDRAAEAARRIEKARAWLVSTKAVTNEDRTFRLLGLKWAGADPREIEAAAKELRAAQRPDGGWAQLPADPADPEDAFARSDAYATGQALYALHVAGGLSAAAEPYRRGAEFLIRTQDDDGSWLVTKRAIPANTYFDGGFPHGQSQYISYGASCWATMALLFAAQPPPAADGLRQAAVTR